jgi:hypothetical protein
MAYCRRTDLFGGAWSSSHPNKIVGMAVNFTVGAKSNLLVSAVGGHSILIVNDMLEKSASFSISGQLLTNTGKELLAIANSPPTDIGFLRTVAIRIREDLMSSYGTEMGDGLLKMQVGSAEPEGNRTRFEALFAIA